VGPGCGGKDARNLLRAEKWSADTSCGAPQVQLE
jgi:hypothetical protein